MQDHHPLRIRVLRDIILFLGSLGLASAAPLTVREDATAGTLSIFRPGGARPILVQNAAANARPYLHPLVSPDGTTILTETKPAHHPHQTGIYWGLTRVNGRDYFHNPGAEYWRKVARRVLIASGE